MKNILKRLICWLGIHRWRHHIWFEIRGCRNTDSTFKFPRRLRTCHWCGVYNIFEECIDVWGGDRFEDSIEEWEDPS